MAHRLMTDFSSDALVSIGLLKKAEAEKTREEFDAFCESLNATSASSPLEQAQAQLEKARKFWGVRDIYSTSHTEIRAINATDRGNIVTTIYSCQRDLTRAARDPGAHYLVDQVIGEIKSLVDLEKKQLQYTELFSREILNAYNEDLELSNVPLASRTEQVEQLKQWRELAQKEDTVDPAKVASFLEETFMATAQSRKATENLRHHFKNVTASGINFSDIKEIIQALIKSDSLDDAQTKTLTEYLRNKDVLKELASVLDLRVSKLDQWNWSLNSSGAIKAYQRRKLNGRYRVYFDQNLLDTILCWKIGQEWCTTLNDATSEVYSSVWESNACPDPDNIEVKRRKHYLRDNNLRDKVTAKLEKLYKTDFFMSAVSEQSCGDYDSPSSSPVEKMQTLLRSIAADVKVRKVANDPVAVLAADFAWFGPSISYNAVFEVLKFFEVPEMWLNLFRRYLQIPFQFDGCPVEIRKRGLPMNSNISTFCSESLLFVLDYAFNQATKNNLFRMNDDLWIWGPPEKVLEGWQLLNKFNSIVGLTINQEKTGCKSTIPLDGLPTGSVKYGYLTLNDDMNFVVNAALVQESLSEMQRQLGAYSTAFNKVKAYNKYIKFMLVKCSKPCNAFGLEHVDSLISALIKPIDPTMPVNLEFILSNTGLAKVWQDLPRAVWYWPVSLGGFNLFDPLPELFQVREKLVLDLELRNKRLSPDRFMVEYEKYKKLYETENSDRDRDSDEAKEWRKEGFMGFEEYKKWIRVGYCFTGNTIEMMFDALLLGSGTERHTSGTKSIDSLLQRTTFDSNPHIKASFNDMNAYWQEIVRENIQEVLEKQGKVQLIVSELAPMGLAQTLSKKPQRWNA